MEYFYTPVELIAGKELTVRGEDFLHLARVMRKRAGDIITVVDGAGTAYTAQVVGMDRREARCEIRSRHPHLHEPMRQCTLAVALLKNAARFDLLVEKATELGVSAIVPLRTERTIPSHARVERWQTIALSAMKQSGRCVHPAVSPPTPFTEFIERVAHGSLDIILHEQGKRQHLRTVDLAQQRKIRVCIGPEGGFSDREVDAALKAGYVIAGLGERRLRTETAAITAAALLLA